eukprot:Opistho-1_new@13901
MATAPRGFDNQYYPEHTAVHWQDQPPQHAPNMHAPPNSGFGGYDSYHQQQPFGYGQPPQHMAPPLHGNPPPAAPGGNPPCSTLFVANIPPQVAEQELRDLFVGFGGFRRLRLNSKGATPVCFVEFQEIHQAVQAMGALQGFQFSPNDRGGLRIEYARSKMSDHVLPGAGHHTGY